MILRIGGVKGVGKSHTTDSLVKIFRKNGYEATSIAGITAELGFSREELHSRSQQVRLSARELLLQKIDTIERTQPDRILLRGAPFATYDELTGTFQEVPLRNNETGLYLIDAKQDIVLARRAQDITVRPDRKLDPLFLEQERQQEFQFANKLALERGLQLAVIDSNMLDSSAVALEIFRHFDASIHSDPELKLRHPELNTRHFKRSVEG